EGGLEGVLRVVQVAQHAPAHAEDQRAVAAEQEREGGLVVPGGEAPQQVGVVLRRPGRAGGQPPDEAKHGGCSRHRLGPSGNVLLLGAYCPAGGPRIHGFSAGRETSSPERAVRTRAGRRRGRGKRWVPGRGGGGGYFPRPGELFRTTA